MWNPFYGAGLKSNVTGVGYSRNCQASIHQWAQLAWQVGIVACRGLCWVDQGCLFSPSCLLSTFQHCKSWATGRNGCLKRKKIVLLFYSSHPWQFPQRETQNSLTILSYKWQGYREVSPFLFPGVYGGLGKRCIASGMVHGKHMVWVTIVLVSVASTTPQHNIWHLGFFFL